MKTTNDRLERYSRQVLYHKLGPDAQRQLMLSSAALVGCGALGTVLADILVRAGVGFVRVIDRDFVELNNLQRQVLFDEVDVAENLPKAEAAVRKLRKINSGVELEGIVRDVNAGTIENLAHDVDIILDGTDNFPTRYLINDFAVQQQIPWVYGACVGTTGSALPIIPRETACLRCVFPTMPGADESPSCDSVGVLSPIVHWVAAQQAMSTIKILCGLDDELQHEFITMDCWTGRVARIAAQRDAACPCCANKKFDFLDGPTTARTAVLCGRNAIQLTPADAKPDDKRLERIAARLPRTSRSDRNAYLIRFTDKDYTITVFPDARTIVQGTEDPAIARELFAKYVED